MLATYSIRRNESIKQSIENALHRSAFVAVRRLKCDFDSGTLTIAGSVPTYYTKQVALNIAQRFADIEEMVDCVEVRSPAVCR